MDIRDVLPDDLPELLQLYTHLHGNSLPKIDDNLAAIWERILKDKDHHVLVGHQGRLLVSSCVLVIVPNLTHGQRPYALVENVVTRREHRGKGYATRLLQCARDIAVRNHCYKIMLMTGSRLVSTWRFYERAGYNRVDKTAFIQWLG